MRAKLLLALVAMLWIGMTLAVGMESVVKFDTPTLTRIVGFDEGRHVFAFFNKVQFVLLAVMFVLVMNRDMEWMERLIFVLLAAVLVAQVFWLFPELSQHVDMLLSGVTPPPTNTHAIYGWVELIKVALLSILAFRVLFQSS
jgi:hypothetical protein